MITPVEICDQLRSGMSELFTCSLQGDFIKIRTPYLYPDGDIIDLFCTRRNGVLTVTDLGESIRWLKMQSVSTAKRSIKQQQLINDTCMNHEVEYFRGMIMARCKSGESFAEILTRVAQAAMRVSDLWFTFKTRAVETITDEVADYLTENKILFDRNKTLEGRSGKAWTLDFHVRALNRSSLVNVLKTANRSTAPTIIDHTVAAWHDLSSLTTGREGLRLVSLFDDTIDVWNEEDFRRLESLSHISRWSRPDQFILDITNAA
jgi:hypothetical protein